MSDALLGLAADHGGPALFAILAANCLGVPFPTSLLLLALGSFAGQGEVSFWGLLFWGLAGAALGDQAGYFLGRLGGQLAGRRLARRPRAAAAAVRAELLIGRWGGLGVFFSRWLLAPLAPWVNMATGAAAFPWPRFTLWALLGEALWLCLYLGLGLLFSHSIQSLAGVLGGVTWLLVVALVTLLLGWALLARLRADREAALEPRRLTVPRRGR